MYDLFIHVLLYQSMCAGNAHGALGKKIHVVSTLNLAKERHCKSHNCIELVFSCPLFNVYLYSSQLVINNV